MRFRTLVIWCLYATLLTVAVTALLSTVSTESNLLWLMTIYSVVYFVLFCVVLFRMAKKAVMSKDLTAVSKLFLGSVLVKLFTALALVVGFLKWYEPEENLFVFPFIAAYVAFTTVEVISLKKL